MALACGHHFSIWILELPLPSCKTKAHLGRREGQGQPLLLNARDFDTSIALIMCPTIQMSGSTEKLLLGNYVALCAVHIARFPRPPPQHPMAK